MKIEFYLFYNTFPSLYSTRLSALGAKLNEILHAFVTCESNVQRYTNETKISANMSHLSVTPCHLSGGIYFHVVYICSTLYLNRIDTYLF